MDLDVWCTTIMKILRASNNLPSAQATYLKKSPSPTENKALPGASGSDPGRGLRCLIQNGETQKSILGDSWANTVSIVNGWVGSCVRLRQVKMIVCRERANTEPCGRGEEKSWTPEEGDIKILDCINIARPDKSISLYEHIILAVHRQMRRQKWGNWWEKTSHILHNKIQVLTLLGNILLWDVYSNQLELERKYLVYLVYFQFWEDGPDSDNPKVLQPASQWRCQQFEVALRFATIRLGIGMKKKRDVGVLPRM